MKEVDERIQVYEERDYKVVKANEIIQRARADLGLMEQKTFCYIVSKIKPTDNLDTEYTFTINEYCEVCGIEKNNGKNTENVKAALQKLLEKAFWISDEEGDWISIHWLQKARVSPKRGKVTVRLDEDMQKYLLGLQSNYTQYSLLYVLPMRSAYSIRLYELLKSYSGLHRKTFDIEDLKQRLLAPYSNFKDFRKYTLEIATREINQYTDIEITWEPITKGRKVVQVHFEIKAKSMLDTTKINLKDNAQLDGQMRLNLDGSITEERR